MDGNKIVLFIKSIFTALGTVWSFIVGTMGWAFPTLLVMMAADFITGMMAGSKNEGLSSSRGREGFKKKVYILILIGAVYLLERSIFGTQHLGDGVTIAYIIIEFISLAENGGKLGVNIGPVKNIIAVLKEKGDGK
ncbi:phage holin family protein [Metabacillus sp. B2-18]|uniref:phage holin family protein n=1 Tax=Metabacillus sp. B2-18 TaxID=2897333 RepID=UPI001E3E392C|nr:phage holin family protein [Metabacillus sp. B2-18]UGB31721.1 phage holin family protein [Metabacillus sp. B2-18]